MEFDDKYFDLVWGPESKPVNKKPPTIAEIAEAMDELRRKALKSTDGVVEIKCRTQVAQSIAAGINNNSEDTVAGIDMFEDPIYSSEQGCYVSVLTVGMDKAHYENYLDKY